MIIIKYIALIIPIVFGVIAILKWKSNNNNYKEIFIKLGIVPFKISHILIGLSIGALAFTFVFIVFNYFELMSIKHFSWNIGNIYVTAIGFVLMAIMEELISRSFFISGLKIYLKSTSLIIIITAIFFSIAHMFNNGVTFLSSLSTFVGGIMYAYAFIKTKNIWLPIGLHFSWNFFQGCIYGFPVSGLKFEGLYEINIFGSDIWTGGQYGPEGGLIGIFARIFVIIALWISIKYLLIPTQKLKKS